MKVDFLSPPFAASAELECVMWKVGEKDINFAELFTLLLSLQWLSLSLPFAKRDQGDSLVTKGGLYSSPSPPFSSIINSSKG